MPLSQRRFSLLRREIFIHEEEEEKKKIAERKEMAAKSLAAKKARVSCNFCGRDFHERGIASHEKHCKGRVNEHVPTDAE